MTMLMMFDNGYRLLLVIIFRVSGVCDESPYMRHEDEECRGGEQKRGRGAIGLIKRQRQGREDGHAEREMPEQEKRGGG